MNTKEDALHLWDFNQIEVSRPNLNKRQLAFKAMEHSLTIKQRCIRKDKNNLIRKLRREKEGKREEAETCLWNESSDFGGGQGFGMKASAKLNVCYHRGEVHPSNHLLTATYSWSRLRGVLESIPECLGQKTTNNFAVDHERCLQTPLPNKSVITWAHIFTK